MPNKINIGKGIQKIDINDDKDDFLNIKAIKSHEIKIIVPRNKLKANRHPRIVATPLPPLNFNQIGKQCPIITNIIAMQSAISL